MIACHYCPLPYINFKFFANHKRYFTKPLYIMPTEVLLQLRHLETSYNNDIKELTHWEWLGGYCIGIL